MKLSVIIVNYNVKYFLEQCLLSVKNAAKLFGEKYGQNSLEVFIVDNNSVDGSVEMIKENFSEFVLIDNRTNLGFAKANNQALKIAAGQYVLLLNPDTLIQEDTLIKIIEFADNTPDAGAIGVKMIDGSGKFLPESKRGFPSPAVAFYKIFGFSALFPKSKKFGKYYLSYLDKDKISEIDVLSGAFMLIRKNAIDKAGLLDESFFMYGEDIDLSYRIKLAGFKNYYFPETVIIHYKGESTKKGSLNYVYIFYNAMIIFANKHFTKKYAGIFSLLIKTAVVFRASLSVLKRILMRSFMPLLDFSVFYAGFYFLKPLWESYKFNNSGSYPKEYMLYAVPLYIAVWIISVWLSGGYEKPVKARNLQKGIITGTIAILLVYSLLDEAYRYSRILLLSGSVWALISAFLTRNFFSLIKIKDFSFKSEKQKNILVISSKKQFGEILNLLKSSGIKYNNVSHMSTENKFDLTKTAQTVKINKPDEIIFSLHDLDSKQIIESILCLSDYSLDFKISGEKSLSIIGSSSVNQSGELYKVNYNSIAKKLNLRKKRILDIISSLLFLIFFPVIVFFVEKKINFVKNIFKTLSGKYTWVGYKYEKPEQIQNLPEIKKSVLSPVDIRPEIFSGAADYYSINLNYARDYKIYNDILIIISGIKNLGK